MPFDPQEIYNTQLAHLKKLAENPASKAHAWYRARELSQGSPELFSGIDEALKEAMSNTQTGEKE